MEDPSMIRRPLLATLAATLLLLTVFTGSVLARPVFVFQTVMTGAAEVPGPGDPDAIGSATIMITPDTDTVCWSVSWARVDGTVVASHIHGPATSEQFAGVVVPLFVDAAFDSQGSNHGCTTSEALGPILDAIVADPSLYYVNVHSFPDFGAGAIRGQLG
jgi:hypothetical protein